MALTNLTFTILAGKIMQAFVSKITSLSAFSTNFSEAMIGRGDKVKVMFVGQQAAARAFVDHYVMDGANANGLDITIDQRPYVSLELSTQDLANMPQLSAERLAEQKGYQLAKAVLGDVWGLALRVNFGQPIWTGEPAGFDNDDVVDIGNTCDEAEWPEEMRSLILKPRYHGSLQKDKAIAGTLGVGGSDVVRTGNIETLNDFALHKSNLIPENGESLIGMAVHPDSILIANRVLSPEKNNILTAFEVYTDPGLGISCVYKEWYDADYDVVRRVFECNYGKRVGNTAALKPLARQ